MTDLFATDIESDDLLIEPDLPSGLDIEPDEPSPSLPAVSPVVDVALVPMPLAEVLGADFPLPRLIKFCPDVRLKKTADEATAYLLSLPVTGAEGLKRVDVALTALRGAQKAIEVSFEDPAGLSNELHRNITGKRAEWMAPGKAAIDTVGKRVYTEQKRLDAIAADERRKAQEQANAEARAQAKREEEAARKNHAPPQVVEELARRVETAVAPPVAAPAAAPPMKGTSTVAAWKSRPAGTPADADPNPKIAEMTPAQIAQVRIAMQAVLDHKAPIAAFLVNWSVLNDRAGSDKSTFNIPGFEAFDQGGVRAKPARRS